jgi:hypothetical protein
MAAVWVSTGLTGEVHRVDGTTIKTKFVYVNFMPLAPEKSFLIYTPAGAEAEVALPIPTVARSAVAGYLPRWGTLAAILACIAGVVLGSSGSVGVGALVSFIGLGIAVAARLFAARLGRLSEDQKARRRVYAAWIGPAVDPRLCGENLDPWVDRVRGFVATRAREVEAPGYRSTSDSPKAWFARAQASDDAALLGAALTLACAEMTRTADRGEQAELRDTHRKLWALLAPRAAEAAEIPGLALSSGVAPIPGKAFVRPRSALDSPKPWIAMAAAVGVAAAGAGGYFLTHPSLYALDASERPGLVLSLDGKRLRPYTLERAGEPLPVFVGKHTLEARDAASGEVVDRTDVTLHVGDFSLVYAPAMRSETCVLLQDVHYGSVSRPNRTELLDPGASSWTLSERISYPFVDPPTTVRLDGHDSGTTRWALSVVRCKSRAIDP